MKKNINMWKIWLCLLPLVELGYAAGQMDIDLDEPDNNQTRNIHKKRSAKSSSHKMSQKELESLDDDDLLDDSEDSLNTTPSKAPKDPDALGDTPHARSGVYAGAKGGVNHRVIHIDRTTNKVTTTTNESNTSNEENENSTLEFTKLSPDISLYLGYVHAVSVLRLGAEFNVDFLPSSQMDVKVEKKTTKVAPGTEYSVDGKVGIDVGLFEFYGKLGVNLSRWKYNFAENSKSDGNKRFLAGAQWGAGVQWNAWNHVALQLEFKKNFNKKMDLLDTQSTTYTYNNSKIGNTKYTLGLSYKF